MASAGISRSERQEDIARSIIPGGSAFRFMPLTARHTAVTERAVDACFIVVNLLYVARDYCERKRSYVAEVLARDERRLRAVARIYFSIRNALNQVLKTKEEQEFV